jgi:hypothetical protein
MAIAAVREKPMSMFYKAIIEDKKTLDLKPGNPGARGDP